MLKNFTRTKFSDDHRVGPFLVWSVLDNNNYLIFNHLNNSWRSYNIKDLFAPSSNGINIKKPVKMKEDAHDENWNDIRMPTEVENNIPISHTGVSNHDLIPQIPSPIKHREELKSPIKLKNGTRVKVWFQDKKQDYNGTILDGAGKESYIIKWDKLKKKERSCGIK